MEHILLMTLLVIVTIIFIMLAWLIWSYQKLKHKYTALDDHIERNTKDIAGLCSAAVSVDSRLSKNKVQLTEIEEKVTDFEQHGGQSVQPYHLAIQKVRNGADAEELIEQCGLSREEAVLLIRLHGNKS